MREIYEQIPELARTGERAAYCSVVHTVGSTPQKPGAKLLIFPTGQSIGTLGGGCVEAEARKQAIRLMHEGKPRLLEFRLDSDYGWDDGLICGGRMTIFIDLTDRASDATIFEAVNRLLAEDVPLVMATVVKTEGAAEGVTPGNKYLLAANGERFGTLGSEALDEAVVSVAVDVLDSHRPELWTSEDGSTTVYVEAMLPQVRLIICGAGHVGAALTPLAAMCDFHVTVLDDRAEFANKENLPAAHRILVGDMATLLREIPIDPMTYVVIVTRGHRNDEECLHAVIDSDAGYIGLIGSRRKIKLLFDDLIEMGVPEARLERVHAPIGLDIASQTVPEIAVSIVAQLIQVRNTRKLAMDAEGLRRPRA